MTRFLYRQAEHGTASEQVAKFASKPRGRERHDAEAEAEWSKDNRHLRGEEGGSNRRNKYHRASKV